MTKILPHYGPAYFVKHPGNAFALEVERQRAQRSGLTINDCDEALACYRLGSVELLIIKP